jgi:hypothetical protein
MSTVSHEALIKMMAECNRHVPINANDPAIAALVAELQVAQQDVAQQASAAARKTAAVQECIHRLVPFVTDAEPNESDPTIGPLVSTLRAARTEFDAAVLLTMSKVELVLDILRQIERTARNSCTRFN